MDVHGARGTEIVIAPDPFDQVRSGKHAIRGAEEHIKQIEFLSRHRYLSGEDLDGIAGEVDLDLVELDDLVRLRAGRAADHGPYARRAFMQVLAVTQAFVGSQLEKSQFIAYPRRLVSIVAAVRAMAVRQQAFQGEAGRHMVKIGVRRFQYRYHRDILVLGAEILEEGQAVFVGEILSDDDEIERFFGQHPHDFARPVGGHDRIALPVQHLQNKRGAGEILCGENDVYFHIGS